LAIGLDKNTNSGDKIFFNINGTWEPNVNVVGSLMIRPIFGKGDGIITGVEDQPSQTIRFYPNPNKGIFTVPASVKELFIYDVGGRKVNFLVEEQVDGKRIQLLNAARGIYILRLLTNAGVTSHRLMVE
ncbi:MAG TPA: T9SS type A sorting domain-containing protein, partial [Cyclobacteriaceae bacterium]|nr:T9SS type A sorting domain-containing protein [Cyclobacteriaceae bacterium]